MRPNKPEVVLRRIIFYLVLFFPVLAVANHAPSFLSTSPQSLSVCKNSTHNIINSFLSVSDLDSGQTEVWSVMTNPVHGTLDGFDDSTISNGTTIVPGESLFYNPAIGYSGTDSFTINISDSFSTSTIVIIVTVHPLPAIGVTPTSATICSGNDTALTGTGGVGYSWLPAIGLGSVSGSTIRLSPGSTVTYTVTGIDVNGCSNIATRVVTVNPSPLPITGDSITCTGQPIYESDATPDGFWRSTDTSIATIDSTGSLIGITGNYSTNIQYTLSSGCYVTRSIAVNTDSLHLPPSSICKDSTIIVINPSSGNPWVTYTGTSVGTQFSSFTYSAVGGCEVDYIIVVHPLPNVTISPNSAVICATASIDLTAHGASSYHWISGTISGSTTDSTVVAMPIITSTYSVIGTTTYGCKSMASRIVSVNPLPTITIVPDTPTLCFGGSITLIAAGASTYQWTPAATLSPITGGTVTATPISTTIYTVTGTDSHGCVNYKSDTVNVNPIPLPPSVVPTTQYCQNAVAIPLTAIGSNIRWYTTLGGSLSNTVAPTPSTSILGNTTYYLSQTVGGCESPRDSIIVTIKSLPAVIVSPSAAAICIGWDTTLTAAGGLAYSWSPLAGLSSGAGTTVVASPTVTTTYTVTGTGSNGCSNSSSKIVTVYPLPAILISASNPVICNGNTTTISAGGGSTYIWTSASSLSASTGPSVIASPTTTTTYTITGTDIHGCINSTNETVIVNPVPAVPVVTPTISVCQNSATGSLTATGTGLLWYSTFSGGVSSSVAPTPATTTLGNTIYYVSQTVGCESARDSITVTVKPLPTITLSPSSAAICYGNDTMLTAAGGITYSWSPSMGLSATTGSSVVAAPTINTVYTVTGTGSNSCYNTASKMVTVYTLPVIGFTPASPSICAGGDVVLTANGALTYSWFPTSSLSVSTGTTVTSTPTVTTLYTVSGTDAHGCSAVSVETVNVNNIPPVPGVTSSVSYCKNGIASPLTASGSSILWYTVPTGGAGTSVAPVPSTLTVGHTTYYVSQTVSSCESSRDSILVTIKSLPGISISPSATAMCTGSSTLLMASGGVSYVWQPSIGLSATTGTSVTAAPTSTEVYTLTGIGSNGCSNTSSMVLTVNSLPVISVTPTNPAICNGSNITLTAVGGSIYSWSPAANLNVSTGSIVVSTPSVTTAYSLSGTDAHGCSSTIVQIVTVNSIPAAPTVGVAVQYCQNALALPLSSGGSSTLWYSTSLGGTGSSVAPTPATTTVGTTIFYVSQTIADCESSRDSISVTVKPLPVITILTPTTGICAGGSTMLTASIGLTYTWSPSIGLSATTGSTVTANPIANTIYSVIGTATNGCSSSATEAVTVFSLPIIGITPVNPVICNGGSKPLTASGASTYLWTNSATLNTGTGSNVISTPSVTTIYTITGTDVHGCIDSTTDTVKVNPIPFPPVTADTIQYCQDLSALSLNVSTTGIDLLWYTSLTSSSASSIAPVPFTTIVGNTTYYVSQTVAGCESPRDSTVVIVKPLPGISISPATAAMCIGYDTMLIASGGTSYSWSPALGLSSTIGSSVTASPMATVTYTVTGNAPNGCSNTATREVIIYQLPTITISPNDSTICNGSGTTLTVSGASNYLWESPGTLSSSVGASVIATPSASTTYTVTGTDIHGCVGSNTDILNVNVIPPAPLTTPTLKYCQNLTVPALTATGLSLLWYSTVTSGTAFSVTPTPSTSVVGNRTYYVSQTVGGCQSPRDSTTITIDSLPIVIVSPATSAICIGGDTTLSALGAVSYSWTPAAGLVSNVGASVTASPLVSVTYSVTGTDANGCMGSAFRAVTVYSLPTINVTPADSTICYGSSLSLAANGALNYVWSPSGSLSTATGSSVVSTPAVTTIYTVTGTDIHGCINTNSDQVNVNPIPAIPVVVPTKQYCLNAPSSSLGTLATGSALFWYTSATGGTGTNTAPVPSTSTVGNTTYYVSQTVGGCESRRDSIIVIINPLPDLISGTPSVCNGYTAMLSDATLGGVWSMSNLSLATINSFGLVSGISLGTDTVTYTLPTGCLTKIPITINPLPDAITGIDSVCAQSSVSMSDLTPLGTWSTSDPSLASINSAGILTGLTAGLDTVRYTISTGCKVTFPITINPLPEPLYGDTAVCVGSTIILTDSGGAIAYEIIAVVPGVTTVTLSTIAGCSSHISIVVNRLPANIGGMTGLCLGTTSQLTDSIPGGMWSSDDTSIAQINDTGLVYATSIGVTTITYTLPTGCYKTKTVSVSHLFTITGLETINPSTCLGTNGSMTLNGLGTGVTYDVNYFKDGIADTVVKTANSIGNIFLDSLSAGAYSAISVSLSGCTSNSLDTLLVDPPPPAVPVLSDNSPLCAGTSLHLNSSDSTPGVSYLWTGPTAFLSSLQYSHIDSIAPVDSGYYKMRVGINNCFSFDSVFIHVVSIPQASAIEGDSVICIGATSILTDSVPGGMWFSQNLKATISSIGEIEGISYGNDTLRYIIANMCGADTVRKELFINRIPLVDPISSAAFICVGSTINVYDSVSGGSWTESNLNSTISSSGIATGITPGTDTIRYTVTDVCGTTIVMHPVAIIALPDAGTIYGTENVCLGDTVILSDSVIGGVWSAKNGHAIVNSGGVVQAVTIGVDSIKYSYTNSCGTDIAVKAVDVITLPDPGIITGPSKICTNADVIFADTLVEGLWASSNINLVIDSIGIARGIILGKDTIEYLVTNKCGTSTAKKAVDIFTPPPSHISIHSQPTSCTNTLYQNFGADSLPPTHVMYIWRANNAEIFATSLSKQNCLISFHDQGQSTVTLTAFDLVTGCSSTDSFNSVITSDVSPSPTVSYYASIEFVCQDHLADTYQWGFDNKVTLDSSLITAEINEDYLNTAPAFSDNYYWVMTIHNGCLQKSYYNTPLEIMQYTGSEETIVLFPNPANDEINIDIKQDVKGGRTDYSLYDMHGNLVKKGSVVDGKGSANVSDLASGIYLISFSKDGITFDSRTFIKNK